jgi:hypothetical protein
MNRDVLFGLKIIVVFVIVFGAARFYLDWKDKQTA